MKAIEFRAKVENGVIHVPAEYRSHLSQQVRVILLAEGEEERGSDDMIGRLLRSPRKVRDFKPLSRDAIYDE